MNGFDLSTIIDAKLGAVSLDSIYLGSNKIWPTIPPDPYSLIPVTIENISDNDVTLTVTGYGSRNYELYYSDPFKKYETPPDGPSGYHKVYQDTYDFVTLHPEHVIRLWANDKRSQKSQSEYYSITSDGPINIYGNVKSLLDMDNEGYSVGSGSRYWLANYFNSSMVVDASHLVLPDTKVGVGFYYGMFKHCTQLTAVPKLPATTLATACYHSMFNDCTSLTTAPVLPATTLAASCYAYMFNNCTSLTTAPVLPATTLSNNCYQSMFANCSSLVTVPSDLLPATTLASGCYRSMFDRCTSLTTAPVLPATTLVTDCYRSMFYNDSALTYIKAMFTTTPGTSYTKTWVYGVSATGTYVKNSAASYTTTGDSAIPSGWTVQTAST
jgi:hypothetical protein